MAQTSSNNAEYGDRRYIAAAMRAPMLERDYEVDLGRRWRDRKDEAALGELVESHVRLVVRIASRFRGYGLPVGDLIQEGNIGLLEAAKRFDPEREVRFSTYASWWILAGIQEYIVRNSSIIRIGTTPAQKSLFFNLRKLRAKIAGDLVGLMTDAERQVIARELKVPIAAVERMEAHFSGPDRSLNASVGDDDGDALQDFLPDSRPTPEENVIEMHDSSARASWLHSALDALNPREKDIIQLRFLDDEKVTLAEIGESYGVTKERIRQIEGRALKKLKAALAANHGEDAMIGNA